MNKTAQEEQNSNRYWHEMGYDPSKDLPDAQEEMAAEADLNS
ncbi:MAG TPA: hypothetical protein VI911_09780 [Patescibacteria group bacterium]|nr:hypothetical protein [Patescibacteria group bacterium]